MNSRRRTKKGSLVNPNYLRFDFSHFAKMTETELQQVEDFVNARTRSNYHLEEEIPIQQALEEGAMALFGEIWRYGARLNWRKHGTLWWNPCKNTAEIWHFKIVSEGAVAAGIRRIEAITSDAVSTFAAYENTLNEVKNSLEKSSGYFESRSFDARRKCQIRKQIEALVKDKVKI
jgi:alanyl-tRNA synthetase